ncbi:MAG: hypothetical protein IKM95_00110 [Bacteroidales bacterium]|nr:hypothetical protein [Bacteroidales bacterium]
MEIIKRLKAERKHYQIIKREHGHGDNYYGSLWGKRFKMSLVISEKLRS